MKPLRALFPLGEGRSAACIRIGGEVQERPVEVNA